VLQGPWPSDVASPSSDLTLTQYAGQRGIPHVRRRNKEIVRRYWQGRFDEIDYAVIDEMRSASADADGQKAWLDEHHAAFGDTPVRKLPDAYAGAR